MSIYVTYDMGYGLEGYVSNATTYDQVREEMYNIPAVGYAWFDLESFPQPYDNEDNPVLEPDYDRDEYMMDPDAPVEWIVPRIVDHARQHLQKIGREVPEDLEQTVRDYLRRINTVERIEGDCPFTDRSVRPCTDPDIACKNLALGMIMDVFKE